MKHLIITILFLALAQKSFSQNTEIDSNLVVWTYCELVGTLKFMSNKVTVEVDYGQEIKSWSFQDDRIVDPATGKPKNFNSMVDAMNFMGESGWEFVQAYVVTSGNQNIYHWLLKLQVQKNDVGKYVPLTKKGIKGTPK
jgi:hypothetical protein